MGPTHADRALDCPDLAICLCYRCARLFDALQMVPSFKRDAGNPACKVGRQDCRRHDTNLALGDDLMFHQNDTPRRKAETLW